MPAAEHLVADVEGDIEDVEGVLRITRIRLKYRVEAPAGSRQRVERALENYAAGCPAYQSVKGCIECTWDAEILEQ